ncbi:protease modulator HflC [Sedimentibacter sp. zth1]|uniref:protease modulator HflC n=1 Tax=Sedimentibacter sp. zth1 TaxID=2816908 RepID=UPI001A92113E|nr:protease modulator HflC [Sedimentibacter sp. zth1]QSX05834.1 protease modulator HflC [Sedimentibacter sp. zth1]
MKKAVTIIASVLVILIIFSSVTVITYENEYNLIKQFGKVNRVISNSGISFKIPFMESVETLPKCIILYDLAASDVITKDKKAMVADSYVLWEINDPLKFAQSLSSSVSNAESRIDTVVYNALKTLIGSQTQNDVINSRNGSLNSDIMELVMPPMKEYGISILSVETKRLDLPNDNKNAVFNRMISERGQIAAGYIAEGEEESQKIQNSTNKEIKISLSEADAQAETLIAEGEAEYMRILSESYNNDDRKDFYEFIRSLDAVKKSLKGDNKTVILPIDSPLTKILLGQ